MSSSSLETDAGAGAGSSTLAERLPRGLQFPGLTLFLTAAFVALIAFPRIRSVPSLVSTFAWVAGCLVLWHGAVFVIARRQRRKLTVDWVPPVKSHYVQASVQFGIYLYWGWYWPDLYAQAPLILAQLVFLCVFDALLSWSRGRNWRPGFGILPIIFSTNFFLWFTDDVFVWQFVMVALCALGKELVTWRRDGKRTHIFNPSAFGLTVASIALIATGATKDYSWARELASTIDSPPHIFLVIFLLGLVVQYFFAVTLMTFSAVAVLVVLNLAYTGVTGSYEFVNTNISAAVFLGMHLLVTDPATSPRNNTGRVIFGALYGLGNWLLFDLFTVVEVPTLYTKLLMVPVLNLFVPWIDRATRAGALGALERAWTSSLAPRALNIVHMSAWAALFAWMWGTGFVEAPHPGNSVAFWKQARADGKRFAEKHMVLVTLIHANRGSAAANNELGIVFMEGTERVQENHARAARYFGIASETGDLNGSANVAIQYLFHGEERRDGSVARALDNLERTPSPLGRFLLGFAFESGRGRPKDPARAITMYELAAPVSLFAAKGLARMALSEPRAKCNLSDAVTALERASERGDTESTWYLAYLAVSGRGGPPDVARARQMLTSACERGLNEACAAAQSATLPPYVHPKLSTPNWVSSYPLEQRTDAAAVTVTPPAAGSAR